MIDIGAYRDKFAESGLRVFERAVEESQQRQQTYLIVGHFLKALAAEDATSFAQLAREVSKDIPLSEELVESVVGSGPVWKGRGVRLSPDMIRLLKRAMRIAQAAGRKKIEIADLFIAFGRTEKSGSLFTFLRISPPHSLVVRA